MNEFGEYFQTIKFNDIYPDVDTFTTEYNASALKGGLTEDNITTLYYLLYSKYGNSNIANNDTTQWKYRLFAIIFQYGPAWQKKLDIQDKLRNLTETELLEGSKAINSHGYNPSTELEGGPNPNDYEIKTVNEQTSQKQQRSKLDAYGTLWDLLSNDVTEEFLAKFRKLFLVIVEPQLPLWYEGND